MFFCISRKIQKFLKKIKKKFNPPSCNCPLCKQIQNNILL